MDTIEQVASQPAIEQEQAEKNGSASVVAVDGLHKSFGSQTVLNGVSLTVKRGETDYEIGTGLSEQSPSRRGVCHRTGT